MFSSLKQRFDLLKQHFQAWLSGQPEPRQQLIRKGLMVAVILLPLLLVGLPMLVSRLRANQELDAAQEQLTEILTYEKTIRENGLDEREGKRRNQEEGDSSLLGTLNTITRKLAITPYVKSMRPKQNNRNNDEQEHETVEIQLTGLVLEELAQLLYQLEVEHTTLQIERLTLERPADADKHLRVALEVSK